MTMIEFLDSFGIPYKFKGDEAVFELCPFCKHEHSKNRFLVNTKTGAYICNRQNSCGVKGHFKWDSLPKTKEKKEQKEYVTLRMADFNQDFTQEMLDYMAGRGISKETLINSKIFNRNGRFCFFYVGEDEAGTCIGVKYRTIDKKISAAKGSVMNLLNWRLVPKDAEELYIVEGECFKGDVQIFTEKGFVRFDELKNEKVLQVKNDMTGEFVIPLQKIKKQINEELVIMKNSRNNWEHISTKGHNVVYYDYKKRLTKKTALEFSKGITGSIPTAISFNGIGTGLSKDEIALRIAISADSKMKILKNGKSYFHFGFKKERKIKRLRDLLNRLCISYTSYKKEYGYTTFNFALPEYRKGLPEEWVTSMTLEERKFFIEELVHWDGNKVKGRNQYEFSSKSLKENEIVQAIAHTCGYMSTIMKRKNKFGEWYKTSILLKKNSVSWQKDNSTREHYSGNVYCVTVPTGMILVKINGKITVTGNCDMLSLLEIGIKNVVSVPNGAGSHDWIDYHYEWLEKFKKIILIMDNDEAGKKGIKAIYDRLKHSEIEIKKINLLFYKDPNEILMDESGRMKLKKILETGEEDIMEPKMMDISDVHCDTDDEYYSWGDDAFNRMSGGMRPGEVIIFTGNPGSGKSTFVNNLMANLVEQGIKVFTMQGEFRKEVFKTNICKILSRPGQIETFKHPLKDKLYGKISYEQEKKINTWLKGKITIHTEQTPTKADLIETMEQAYKKNGVKVFVIDNLMTINIDSADKYEAQKNLFIELQEFVKKYNVCLMIVAHPKKNIVKALDEVDDFIISGASEIVNLANAVVFLKRLSEDEVKKLEEQGVEASVGAILTKDRKYGDIRSKGFWNYEVKTGRFLDIKNPEKTKYKEYGWEKLEKKRLIVEMDNLPFLNEG